MHQYRITGRGEIEVLADRLDRRAVPQLTLEFSGDFKGDEQEVSRLLCFLLDALDVRVACDLAPADWVEIGSDEEDEEAADTYAEAYDDGYRDGARDAFETVGNELGPDYPEDEGEPKSYEQGFRDGSAAAFKMLGDVDQGSEDDENDDDELSYDDYRFRSC